MGLRLRTLVVLGTSIGVLLFLGLLAGCGSSNSNSSSTGSSGSGSGTSGSTNPGSNGSSSSGSSGNLSYVYTAGANSILGYGVNGDGSLTAVSGSPYATDTDMNVVTNSSNLYTVGSDGVTLKAYSIDKSTGALTPAGTTNAIVGNTNPQDIVGSLALDLTGASLYIGEFDSSGDDGVNFFNVSSGSTPTEVAYDGSSEVFGPALVFSPDNKFAYSGNCYQANWHVFSYTRSSNGTLSAPNWATGADGPPVTTPGEFPCPAAFAVSSRGFLAIAYTAQPQGGSYLLGTYTINSDGSLTPVASSMATTASDGGSTGNSPVSINFDPSGTYLAVAGDGGVQTFAMSLTGILTSIGQPQDSGVSFQQVAWDKSSHVFATTSSQLYVWNSNNGTLSPASGSPYSGGKGLAVLPLQ